MFSASIAWTSWSIWGECETQHACGKGKQRRNRIQVTNHCVQNKTEETRPCKLRSCPGISHIEPRSVYEHLNKMIFFVFPVNGVWSSWSDWSDCSLTCNNGTRSRRRTCTNPSPRYGGEYCIGISQTIKTCINEACSVCK